MMSIVLKLTASKGKPPKRGIDHYWSVMMDFAAEDKPFTIIDIFGLSNATRNDINDYVQRLLKAELIERVEIGSYGAVGYRALVRQSTAPKVRRDGTIIDGASRQQRMWNCMRREQHSFTSADIAVWGTTPHGAISRTTAKAYVLTLHRAGYLIQLDKGGPGVLASYRLAPDMNTGPLPPMILRTKAVFDQNRHQIIGSAVTIVTEEVSL